MAHRVLHPSVAASHTSVIKPSRRCRAASAEQPLSGSFKSSLDRTLSSSTSSCRNQAYPGFQSPRLLVVARVQRLGLERIGANVQESEVPQTEANTASSNPPLSSPPSAPPSSFIEVARVKDSMGLVDTNLLSTPEHQAWVAAACSALLLAFSRGLITAAGSSDLVPFSLTVLLAYILADFGTGCYHFGVDNYGSASTPVFGPQIDAFQGHHRRPWTITQRQFSNNLHLLARPVFFIILAALLFLPGSAVRDAFLSVFLACVMFSQQFHAWAHTPKNHLPSAVVALQDAGLLVPRRMHGQHHRLPFNINYCIVSGLCNYPLDSMGFFAALEHVIYRVTGVPSRSWCADLHIEGTYFEDGTPSE